MPWSKRISPAIGGDQLWIRPPACGWSAALVALMRTSTPERLRGTRSGRGSRAAVPGEQAHRLDQPLDLEVLGRVVGVREAQRIGELADAVLDLDACVHLHEEVVEALDDALEGGDRVEAGRGAEALALRLHARERALVAAQDLARLAARALGLGERAAPG